ncbi:biliverdin-producing heme oxygenase [Olivibacter sp. SDN3]|uniref:biliverdin-producing heme oxygenase n=1 Tax=Olivibacter sp. SDN3 TaxID=2764720 RepID=UPI0016512050|nr:biliverdin-producing heme oxygenase [Olivibacter sp. SDN3]QNL48603.1 biliverdin-producing heme oxygenase [Olivibacter sp. SDN3]
MLSAKIKEETKSAHQQLEKKVVEKLKAIRSEEDYADFLKYFYAYFSTVEKAITPFITDELLPDHKERRDSSYLKRDIEALVGRVDALPEVRIPSMSDVLEAMGALYVMEGSIMGGSIIVKMLEKNGIVDGISFFSGYGETTGQKWAVFTAVLNNIAKSEEDETKVIDTANQTFSCFENLFDTVTI